MPLFPERLARWVNGTCVLDGITFTGSVRFCRQFRLVHLPIKALEALDACHEFGFGNLHSLFGSHLELQQVFASAKQTGKASTVAVRSLIRVLAWAAICLATPLTNQIQGKAVVLE